jgi:hypothetical protein
VPLNILDIQFAVTLYAFFGPHVSFDSPHKNEYTVGLSYRVIVSLDSNFERVDCGNLLPIFSAYNVG